jgi:hypothetical protein
MLGSSGRCQQNAERDLHRWSKSAFGFPVETYAVPVQVEQATSTDLISAEIPIILVHELMYHLHQEDPELFCSLFLGPSGEQGAVSFWKEVVKRPWGRLHPCLQGATEEDMASLIPVVWHVDGCEIHRNQEHYVYSYASFLCADGVDGKFAFCTIPHKFMREEATKRALLAQITRVIAWQHDVLQSGRMPSTGFRGWPLSVASGSSGGRVGELGEFAPPTPFPPPASFPPPSRHHSSCLLHASRASLYGVRVSTWAVACPAPPVPACMVCASVET